MKNINICDLIENILNKANGIVDCLPFKLQDNIIATINCVKQFSVDNGFNYDNDNYVYRFNISGENLYLTLNSILKDLSICCLLSPNNVYLEDAIYNVDFIFSYMVNHSYRFSSWCNTGKTRIKKNNLFEI